MKMKSKNTSNSTPSGIALTDSTSVATAAAVCDDSSPSLAVWHRNGRVATQSCLAAAAADAPSRDAERTPLQTANEMIIMMMMTMMLMMVTTMMMTMDVVVVMMVVMVVICDASLDAESAVAMA
jgi:hypothetical protein